MKFRQIWCREILYCFAMAGRYTVWKISLCAFLHLWSSIRVLWYLSSRTLEFPQLTYVPRNSPITPPVIGFTVVANDLLLPKLTYSSPNRFKAPVIWLQFPQLTYSRSQLPELSEIHISQLTYSSCNWHLIDHSSQNWLKYIAIDLQFLQLTYNRSQLPELTDVSRNWLQFPQLTPYKRSQLPQLTDISRYWPTIPATDI